MIRSERGLGMLKISERSHRNFLRALTSIVADKTLLNDCKSIMFYSLLKPKIKFLAC